MRAIREQTRDGDDDEREWGSAWEFADYRCNPHVQHDDYSAWDALVARWPKPYGGFGPESEG